MIRFVIHATRSVIGDQSMRRKTMFVMLVIALIFFILFWIACAWLTLTALLLSVFDLLMLRIEARKTQRTLRDKLSQIETPDSPNAEDNE